MYEPRPKKSAMWDDCQKVFVALYGMLSGWKNLKITMQRKSCQ